MARLLKTSFELSIDIDASVGASGPNQREDTGTVQYCLSILSAGLLGPMGTSGGGLFSVPGHGPIKVDGFYGQHTAAYIAAYQAERRKSPGPTMGMLPSPTGSFNSTRRGGGWTFGILANDVRKKQGKPLVDVLLGDLTAPPWLKAAFQM
jgi:hypothetical protein